MKRIKSLTYILTTVLLVACGKHDDSVAFSSDNNPSNNPTSAIVEQSSLNVSEMSSTSGVSGNNSNLDSSSSSSSSSTTNPIDEQTYYNGYYDTLVSWTDGEDLKNQLHAIIRNGYTPISYAKSSNPNWQTNIDADHSKYDFQYLDVLYSSEDVFENKTAISWQREHAFCASLMTKSLTADAVKFKGRATDFHNLFAASRNGNTSRGNKNYGYANAVDAQYTDRTVDNGFDGYSFDPTIFEPADKDKGRVSRAIFYMATMYKDDEQDTVNNILMKGLRVVEDNVGYDKGTFIGEEFAIGHLSDLLEWNNLFSVDYLEMQHNISVYTNKNNPDGIAQGNRNPYVDYPGLVDYVYGSKKDQPGTLKDVVASASYLKCEENEFSHYAIKEAKREYSFGESVSLNDYKVVAVNKNYSFVEVSSALTHSLSGHSFAESDGDIIEATITTPNNEIKYQIVLNPMTNCSSGAIGLTKDGIDDKTPNVDQSIKCGDYDFYFSFTTTYSEVSTKGMTLSNDNKFGGFCLGSGTKVLTGVTLMSKETYTIDQAYIKAYAGNTSSSFNLIIKVGDEVLLDTTQVTYNQQAYKLYGGKTSAPLTGQLSFIFTGTNKLYLNSIAFNVVIA